MNRPGVHLRPAAASDLDAILALERATGHAPHWPRTAYSTALEGWDADAPHAVGSGSTAPRRCLILAQNAARTDGSLAGFAVGSLHPAASEPAPVGAHVCADRVAELESVVVAASARRAGIGRALCGAVIDWCRSLGATELALEVRSGSAAAIALYTGLGFTRAGLRPHYYCDPPDDALVMRLVLD